MLQAVGRVVVFYRPCVPSLIGPCKPREESRSRGRSGLAGPSEVRPRGEGFRSAAVQLRDDVVERSGGGHVRSRESIPIPQLSAGAGSLRTREIASRLSVSEKPVEKHRSNLMRKLGLRSAAAVAAYAIAKRFGRA